MLISGEWIPISGMLTGIVIVVGLPLARAYAKRMEAHTPSALPSGELIARMERMEQGIEAIATEVERIAEGQRFTTKLLTGPDALSDRSGNAQKSSAKSST